MPTRLTFVIAGLLCAFVFALGRAGLAPDVSAEFYASTRALEWSAKWGQTQEVTISAPEELLPTKLPGPMDAGAGYKKHSIDISFKLAPGDYKAELHFFDTHDVEPPTLQIELNKKTIARLRLKPGSAGEPPYESENPSLTKSFPVSVEKTGNRLRITNVSGSWAAIAYIRFVKKRRRFSPAKACRAVFEQIYVLEPYSDLCQRLRGWRPRAFNRPVYTVSRIPPGSPSRLVWSNYSDGNWDLYLRNPAGQIERLTRTYGNERYPRISPDGRWIYYSLDRQGKKSIRRIDMKTLMPDRQWRLDNAEYLNFSGPNVIVFDVFNGAKGFSGIERLDLTSGARMKDPVNYLPALSSMPINQPAPAMNNQVMFFLVNRWGWRVERAPGISEAVSLVATGCRPSPSPDGRRVVMVSNRGHGGTSILIHDVRSGSNQVMVDMQGQTSHEYDPRFSSDGKWLVFTAGPNDEWRVERGANYKIYGCAMADCSAPQVLVDMPGADGFPDLYFAR